MNYQAHCIPVPLCPCLPVPQSTTRPTVSQSPCVPVHSCHRINFYHAIQVSLCTTTRSTVWSVSQSHCVLRPTVCYIPISLCTQAHHMAWQQGVGIAQWLEHQTPDWKVTGSSPCSCGGRIFFSRVNFLCWLLFQYLFHHPCYHSIVAYEPVTKGAPA